MLQILIFAFVTFRASASQISGSGSTTAVFGGDAHYKCTLDNPTGVLQVTWQRLFRQESIENLASYSERFGQQINEPHRGRLIFTEASLSSASITLRRVTWEDESCYICSFNVYPDGSKMKQMCLTVQGISKVYTTHMQIPSSGHEEEDTEVVFSCSATGKPAPTIQWDFPSGVTEVDQPQTITAVNSDRTFTSSRNITLKIPPGWSGHVDCLLNSGMAGQTKERIPITGREKKKKEKEDDKGYGTMLPRSGTALVITAVICICCTIIIAVAVKRKRSKVKRRNVSEHPMSSVACSVTNI